MEIATNAGSSELHPLDVAAQIVGGRSVLAERLDVTVSSIGNWKARGVPIEQCVPIWRVTGGKVTRQMLRPDDWAEIWPELAEASPKPVDTDPLAEAGQPVLVLDSAAAPAVNQASGA